MQNQRVYQKKKNGHWRIEKSCMHTLKLREQVHRSLCLSNKSFIQKRAFHFYLFLCRPFPLHINIYIIIIFLSFFYIYISCLIMTWYRIFRTNSSKKSKLSVVEFDQHIEPIPTCLKQSPVYQHHLVQIHSIVQTYVNLVTMKKRRRQSSQDWTLMETFIKLWYSELERIYKHASGVAVMLKGQISELCTALYSIVSCEYIFI